MKPYGKPSEIRNGCMCCSNQVEHRTESKSQLRRLIIEEKGSLPPESCDVCEAKDYKCVCFHTTEI
jgi:G3E family GTPase